MTPAQRQRKMTARAIELPKVDIAPDAVNVLEGSTFVVSDVRGDVQEATVAGFFHDDTRYLSRFVLTVNDHKLDSLTAGNINYYSAAFYLTNPDMPGLKPRSISVRRSRFAGDGLTEEIWIKNHLDTPVSLQVRLLCAIDFADLFEVKSMDVEKQGALRIKPDEKRAHLNYDYVNGTFKARAQIRSSIPADVTDEGLLYELSLKPREEWETQIQILVHQNDEFLEPKHRAFA